jgi:uncharacterized membrane protein YuzA (DUF378 family)
MTGPGAKANAAVRLSAIWSGSSGNRGQHIGGLSRSNAGQSASKLHAETHLIIVGGINWLLVGLANFDLVATIFGGSDGALATIVYALVGVSALYQLVPFFKAFSVGEVAAESSTRHV